MGGMFTVLKVRDDLAAGRLSRPGLVPISEERSWLDVSAAIRTSVNPTVTIRVISWKFQAPKARKQRRRWTIRMTP